MKIEIGCGVEVLNHGIHRIHEKVLTGLTGSAGLGNFNHVERVERVEERGLSLVSKRFVCVTI